MDEIRDRGERSAQLMSRLIKEAQGSKVRMGDSEKRTMVEEFYAKNDMTIKGDLSHLPGGLSTFEEPMLRKYASELAAMADVLGAAYEHFGRQEIMKRAALHVEELAELFLAFDDHDEVAVFDALVDIDYVNVGTAATFDLPLGQGFIEVHRANMSKTKPEGSSDLWHTRGPNYVAPDLKTVLDTFRADTAEDRRDD